MSDDPEEVKNQDQPEPVAQEPTEQPLTPSGATPGEAINENDPITDFRQSLVKEEEVVKAVTRPLEKKPGIIRRMTDRLSRWSGTLDGKYLLNPKDANPASEGGETIKSGISPQTGSTGMLDDQEIDAQLAAFWPANPAPVIPTAPVETGTDPTLEPSRFDQELTRPIASISRPELPAGLDGVAEVGHSEVDRFGSGQVGLPAPIEETAPPGLDRDTVTEPGTHPNQTPGPAVENENLLEGLEINPPAGVQAALAQVEVKPQLPAPAPEATQPKRGSVIRRLVTGFLMPIAIKKEVPPTENMPDEQIAERLKAVPAEGASEAAALTSGTSASGTPASGEDSANAIDLNPEPAEPGAGGLMPYTGPTLQPVTDEDRALWGGYVNADQAQTAGLISAPPVVVNAPESMGSPDLGDLRGEIAYDEDLLTPTPEPEVETPTEKSDIWDRLFVEQERGEKEAKKAQESPDQGSTEGADTSPWGAVYQEIPNLETQSPGAGDRALAIDSSSGSETLSSLEKARESEKLSWSESEVFDYSAPKDSSTPEHVSPFAYREYTEFDEPQQEVSKKEVEIPNWAKQPPDPAWSAETQAKATDGYGSWYEEDTENDSGLLGLPEPSQEATEELKESTKLYDSIFEEQKQQEMRSELLGEMAEETVPTTGPMPDFSAEPEEKPKPWWARLSGYQMVLIVLAVIILVGVTGLVFIYFTPRPTSSAAVAVVPTVVQPDISSAPNGPYPQGIELTGGWIFSLARSTTFQGKWVPQGGEWLVGTQVRRVVALPWSRQTEAVVRSLQPGDELRVYFNNKQTILYKVTLVEQVGVDDVSVFSDTKPSLAVILYQANSTQRWVVIAAQ